MNPEKKDAKGGGVSPYRAITLSSGIKVELMHYTRGETIVSCLETETPVFGFGFCLSGFTRSRVSCFKDEFEIRGGQSAVYYFPEIKVRSQTSSKEGVWRMSVNVPDELLCEMVESDAQIFPLCVQKLAIRKTPDPFRIPGPITPRMRQLMTQMLHCPYQGIAAKYFVEAEIMELIACKLNEMAVSCGEQKSDKRPPLKKEDVDRLYLAKELLSANLENPLGLCELSRHVGMSRTKLINGFSQVFGTTPGACVRNLRLKRAKQMLFEQDKNLTQIALMVGYASSSHFSRAFRARYGVPPSKYAEMVRHGVSKSNRP